MEAYKSKTLHPNGFTKEDFDAAWSRALEKLVEDRKKYKKSKRNNFVLYEIVKDNSTSGVI